MEKFKNILKEHGLKATIQRLAIYEALINTRKHPTADDIYRVVNAKYSGISLSTVYNTLETFVANNLVKKVSTDNGTIKYDAILDSHHHLLCEDTNTISDYYNDELDNILREYFEKNEIKNFNINDIKLQIKGRFIK